MHSPKDFPDHFISLLKTNGSSGSSGALAGKALSDNDFGGTTEAHPREPVTSHWFSDVQISGARKDEENHKLEEARTTGTARTTEFTGCVYQGDSGSAPAEWHAILAELERRSCPDWLPADRWNNVLSDAEIFLTRWGSAAHSLGWTALDLFSVHSLAPGARVGWWGLLLLIRGGEVVVLTDSAATIRHLSNAVLTFKREHQSGRILLSELPL